MNKYKITVIFLISFLPIYSVSQGISYVGGGVNQSFLLVNHPINGFIDEYNRYYQNDLSQTFRAMKSFSGQGMEASIFFLGPELIIPLNVGTKYLGASRSAMFHNGHGRELSLLFSRLWVNFGMAYLIDERIYLGLMLMEMDGSFVRLKSKAIYPDGSTSLGPDKDLNGVYWATDYNYYFSSLAPEVGYYFEGFLGTISIKRQLFNSGTTGALIDHQLNRSFPESYDEYQGSGSKVLNGLPDDGWMITLKIKYMLFL